MEDIFEDRYPYIAFSVRGGVNLVDTSFLRPTGRLGLREQLDFYNGIRDHVRYFYTVNGVLREIKNSHDWAKEKTKELKQRRKERERSSHYHRGKRVKKKTVKGKPNSGIFGHIEDFRRHYEHENALCNSLGQRLLPVPDIPRARDAVDYVFKCFNGQSKGNVDQDLIMAALARSRMGPAMVLSCDVPQMKTFAYFAVRMNSQTAYVYDGLGGRMLSAKEYCIEKRIPEAQTSMKLDKRGEDGR